MKGIVAEIKGKNAIILTQDGLFKKVKALPGMIVGMETELGISSKDSGRRRLAMKIASIAAAGLLVLGAGLGAYSYSVPYSYIDLDINPSIELTVNIYDRIIGVEALNDDGQRLLQDSSIVNMKLDHGVTELLNSAVEYGYLSSMPHNEGSDPSADSGQTVDNGVGQPENGDDHKIGQEQKEPADAAGTSGGDTDPRTGIEGSSQGPQIQNAVMFTVSSNNTSKSGELKKKIENTASRKLTEDKVDSEILIGQTSIEQRDAARKLGVTPGKLALMEDALKHLPEKRLDDVKDKAVKELIEIVRKNEDEPKDKKKVQPEAKRDKKDDTDNITKPGGVNKDDKGEKGEKAPDQGSKKDDEKGPGKPAADKTKDNRSGAGPGQDEKKDKGAVNDSKVNGPKAGQTEKNSPQLKEPAEKLDERLKKERQKLKDELLSHVDNSKSKDEKDKDSKDRSLNNKKDDPKNSGKKANDKNDKEKKPGDRKGPHND